MQLREIMSREVEGIDRGESVRQAAQKMLARDIGFLPVFEGGVPVGVVTDRDITIRVAAAGLQPDQTPIGSVMSLDPVIVSEEAETAEAAELMEQRMIRRLLVHGPDGRLVGIVSSGDLAVRNGDPRLTSEVICGVSHRAQPLPRAEQQAASTGDRS